MVQLANHIKVIEAENLELREKVANGTKWNWAKAV
jgi:hypothetical protein